MNSFRITVVAVFAIDFPECWSDVTLHKFALRMGNNYIGYKQAVAFQNLNTWRNNFQPINPCPAGPGYI